MPFGTFPTGRKTDTYLIQATEFQSIVVPGWAAYLDVDVVSGGGAGGVGRSAASGTIRAGGGGGGSGARVKMMGIPTKKLPRIIWPRCGLGGQNATDVGERSIIAFYPAANQLSLTNAGDLIAATLNTSGMGNAGTNGTTSAGGAGSGAPVPNVLYAAGHEYAGSWFGYGGQPGTAGSTGSADAFATAAWGTNGVILTGGGGGGGASAAGVDKAGGAVTGGGLLPTLPGGVVSGGAGVDGIEFPWGALGGSGGGANSGGTAGKGGDGAPGCGGGGGAGGTVGGAHGKGGNGFIILYFHSAA